MPLGELPKLMPDLVRTSRAKLEQQTLELLEGMHGAVESLQSAADGFRFGGRAPACLGSCSLHAASVFPCHGSRNSGGQSMLQRSVRAHALRPTPLTRSVACGQLAALVEWQQDHRQLLLSPVFKTMTLTEICELGGRGSLAAWEQGMRSAKACRHSALPTPALAGAGPTSAWPGH